MKRRRRGNGEINLTPLLDVLFTILFIVMLTGTQSEQSMQEVQAQTAAQIEEQQERIAELEAAARSEELFGDTAVILTLRNSVRNGSHVLRFTEGREARPLATIQMGSDRPEYIREYVRKTVEDQIGKADGLPVFIVFYCQADLIYRQEEFIPIKEELERLGRSRKEVFYQIVEE